MAISGEQTAINNNYTKNRLFNHYNARFMEESTLLLLDLSMLFHKISLIIDDDEKLRDSELDYRQLAFIKNDVLYLSLLKHSLKLLAFHQEQSIYLEKPFPNLLF